MLFPFPKDVIQELLTKFLIELVDVLVSDFHSDKGLCTANAPRLYD